MAVSPTALIAGVASVLSLVSTGVGIMTTLENQRLAKETHELKQRADAQGMRISEQDGEIRRNPERRAEVSEERRIGGEGVSAGAPGDAAAANGIIYTGRVSIAQANLGLSSYSTQVLKVTVSVQWTSGNIPRRRAVSTYVAEQGLQNYVYAKN